ncbi:NAD P-binding protein [Moesziomyces antarcticus]|uniref:Related to SPS19 \|nr:NAD P-binding protein [Moesziomyces antarcticus]GAK65983.1 NAD P-binding protein [Moesziomyces antarcticus]SPO46757.1 related to SPS19 \
MTSSSLDFGLKGVHVLVSGASGGKSLRIGFETAKTFVEAGAKVTAHYNTTPRGLADLPGVVALQADVTSETDIARLFTQAEAAQGVAVQVLVVNHGIWPVAPVALSDMSLEQWRNTHAVNLDGAFLLVRSYLANLKNKPSSVLDAASVCFIGSTAGKFGEHDHADYASTKAALMYGLVPSLKNEIVRIAPKARVNSVNPGWVRTPMAEETIKDDKVRARALASTPLQKVALPQDVARQVVVLSSPTLSGHVTGVNLQVDGGMEGRCLYPPPN